MWKIKCLTFTKNGSDTKNIKILQAILLTYVFEWFLLGKSNELCVLSFSHAYLKVDALEARWIRPAVQPLLALLSVLDSD